MIMVTAATLALKRLSASFVYMGMNQMSSIQFYIGPYTIFIRTRRMGAEPHCVESCGGGADALYSKKS